MFASGRVGYDARNRVCREMNVVDDLPVIDMSALSQRDSAEHADAVHKIGEACRGIGFFYVANHGISRAVMDTMFGATRSFFDQKDAVKAQLSIEGSRHNRGYVAYQGEQLEAARPADLKEAFNIGLELPPDDPDLLADVPFRGPNQWPEQWPEWRKTMLAYYDQLLALGARLAQAFAIDLGVDDNYFASAFHRPLAVLRLLHYPPIAQPDTGAGKPIGAGAHTDYGMLTLLAQDGVGGLQVRRRDGTWIDAPVIPHTFICNIGDMLMRWSNDVYVSTPHRVLNPPAKDRYSIAMFCDPAPNTPVACLPGCCSPGRPARYAPTTSGDYLTSRLDATYAFRQEAE